MAQPAKSTAFRCQYGSHGAMMDHQTFQSLIAGLKEKGVDSAEVGWWRGTEYGFNYVIDGDGYGASFVQLQENWNDAAVVCLQTIIAHLDHLGRNGRLHNFMRKAR